MRRLSPSVPVVAVIVSVGLVAGCPPAEPPPLDLSERLSPGQVRAGVVEKDADLIGGPTSVGARGDFKLYNDRIAIIVEAPGPSDGYGTYGGFVVDADVVRPEGEPGRSSFGEAIPLYGFVTVEATEAELVNDGRDGNDAIVRVRGKSAPFGLIDAVLGDPDRDPGTADGDHPDLRYEIDYILPPDSSALRIVTKVSIPDPDVPAVAVNNHFAGYVMGDGLRMFLPTHGFDIPSVPEAGDYFAGASRDVSYSFVHVGGRFVPVVQVEGFQLGSLPRFDATQGEPTEVVQYLVVGDGDLAAHLPVHDALKSAAGEEVPTRVTLSGVVQEAAGKPVAGAFVQVRRGNGDYEIRTTTRADGTFSARLPPGEYTLTATIEGRDPGPDVDVTVAGDTNATVTIGPVGRLTLSAKEGDDLVPFKVLLRRASPPPAPPAAFGLERRHRGYERIEFLPPGGGTLDLPPGDWSVLVSRGFEYETVQRDVKVVAKETARVDAVLVRSVDTTGWVSSDFHIHAQWSPDSDDLLDDKVRAIAAEGVEMPVSTEHDYVGDFNPVVARLGLGKWVRGITGSEISTTPYGHFNAFPLVRDPTQANFGFVSWYGVTGDVLMKKIRARAPDAFVQANHPRSGSFGSPVVKGYLSAVGFDPETMQPRNAKHWTTDFDGLEIANGGAPNAQEYGDWFAFLDHGRRLVATSGSDSHTARSDVVGYPRNYVRTGEDDPSKFDEAAFMAALKAGRLAVSGGYFIEASVDGRTLGDLVPADGMVDVDVTIKAPSWVGGGSWELIVNGSVVGSAFPLPAEDDEPGKRVATTLSLPVPAGVDSWIVVRARGGDLGPVYPGMTAFGFTNPVFVDGDGDGKWTGRKAMP